MHGLPLIRAPFKIAHRVLCNANQSDICRYFCDPNKHVHVLTYLKKIIPSHFLHIQQDLKFSQQDAFFTYRKGTKFPTRMFIQDHTLSLVTGVDEMQRKHIRTFIFVHQK